MKSRKKLERIEIKIVVDGKESGDAFNFNDREEISDKEVGELLTPIVNNLVFKVSNLLFGEEKDE